MYRCATTTLLSTCVLACYAPVAPRPVAVQPPPLSDDVVMNVHTQRRTVLKTRTVEERTCPADVKEKDSPKCTVTTREVTEPETQVVTTATYGAEAISYAQFRVLTEPDFTAKRARLDVLRERCRPASGPRWIGSSLLLTGLVTSIVGGTMKEPVVTASGGGAFAAGIGTLLLGYYKFGGEDCNRAWSLYEDLDLVDEAKQMEVPGQSAANEMAVLVQQFNARHDTLNSATAAARPAENGTAADLTTDRATATAHAANGATTAAHAVDSAAPLPADASPASPPAVGTPPTAP